MGGNTALRYRILEIAPMNRHACLVTFMTKLADNIGDSSNASNLMHHQNRHSRLRFRSLWVILQKVKRQTFIGCIVLLMVTTEQFYGCIRNGFQVDAWRSAKCLRDYIDNCVKFVHLSPGTDRRGRLRTVQQAHLAVLSDHVDQTPANVQGL
ncbi:hypothetical protein TNCV_3254121 [Trichonephila clavipes]|nr:hypothetical protein TNCV_3254121 [Trichonephila clavipes]